MSSAKASKATKAQKPAGVDIRAFMTGSSNSQGKTGSSVSGSRFIPSLWVENTRSSRQRQARVKWRVRNLTLRHQSAAYQVSVGSSSLKRKTAVLSSDDEEEQKKTPPKKKPATASTNGKPAKSSKVIEISACPGFAQYQQSDFLLGDDDSQSPPRKPVVKRKKPAALISSDEDEEDSSPKKKPTPSISKPKAVTTKPRPSTTSKSKTNGKKAEGFVSIKHHKDEDYASASDEEEDLIPKPAKPSPKKKASTSKDTDSKGKEKSKEQPKKSKCVPSSNAFSCTDTIQSWAAVKAAKLAAPVAHGSKDIPDGQPDCLMGLSFVFTGELSSFSREEAIDLAKRFGGYVCISSPIQYLISSQTSGRTALVTD